MELKHTASIYGALTEAIVNQQLSGKAAATIFARVCALFPRTVGAPSERQILRISVEKLRGAGLSQAKTLSLRDLARRTLAGQTPTLKEMEGMDDEAIIEHLVAVRGIGRWTAEMFLLFCLGRPDIFSPGDLALRAGIERVAGKTLSNGEVLERTAAWSPWRSIASLYLWKISHWEGEPAS